MNNLLSIDFGVQGQSLKDVMMRPDNYPDEILGAYLDAITAMSRQIREAKIIMEENLIGRMEKENASKLVFKSIDGRNLIATRKPGSIKCDNKNVEDIMKAHGFQATVVGKYEFKPEWSKAKEARKLGGELQLVIDDLFRAEKEKIEIREI